MDKKLYSESSMGMDFIAIDFETANYNRDSACSIGVAQVKAGKIVDTYSSLIKPPNLNFEDKLTEIHGITVDDVHKAPTFIDVWSEIIQRYSCKYIVAHNASFDVSVLRASISNHFELMPEQYT